MSSIREQYALNETAVVKLKDGNDELMTGADGKEVTVTVYAPGSKAHMRAQARSQGATFEQIQRKGKIRKSGDELARENVEYAVDVTKEFSPNIAGEFPGLEGRALFEAIYADEKIGYLITEQVLAFQRNTANFTRGSAKP